MHFSYAVCKMDEFTLVPVDELDMQFWMSRRCAMLASAPSDGSSCPPEVIAAQALVRRRIAQRRRDAMRRDLVRSRFRVLATSASERLRARVAQVRHDEARVASATAIQRIVRSYMRRTQLPASRLIKEILHLRNLTRTQADLIKAMRIKAKKRRAKGGGDSTDAPQAASNL